MRDIGLSQIVVSLIEREVFEHVSDETLVRVDNIVLGKNDLSESGIAIPLDIDTSTRIFLLIKLDCFVPRNRP